MRPSRRDVLRGAANGFGALALQAMLAREAAAAGRANPLAAKQQHFGAKAKSVIFLFMVGGPSQIDTFDPKPALEKYAGQKLPESFGKVTSQFTDGSTPILPSPWKFKQYEGGAWVSELYPHLAQLTREICFVRNFHTESVVHAPAMYQVATGRILMGYPSIGSWVTYGLGSESENLPGYVVMPQPQGTPEGGTPMWGSAFLPAVYQGTLLRPGSAPILHLHPSKDVSLERQKARLALLQKMNELDTPAWDSELSARIASYELAFRMQSHAPEAVELTKETEATRKLYGLDGDRDMAELGTRLLLARRFVERGVRFVQIYHGGGPLSYQWDAHDHLKANHERMCGMSDKPIAGLIRDLASRGLLESTLVVWGSEFGRLPMSQSGNGRDHNPYGFTMWFAGGGVKGGQVLGDTDEFGLRAVDSWHMRDFHATILHALGLDQHKLWYLHNGRHEKLTDFGGKVIEKVFG